MPITDFLEKNAELYPNDSALVEINPAQRPEGAWKDFNLIESAKSEKYRREITWKEFDEKANAFANTLISKGVKKDDKVGILLMNCLEWLPIYFGILKTGAIAVPLNFRYTADEIKYCVELADISILIYGVDFIDRINDIYDKMPIVKKYIYVGNEKDTPDFCENFDALIANESVLFQKRNISDEDNAAIYFSSGTTGFPKAILHAHKALVGSCMTEQNHHSQQKDDVFLCIPPLYHTGAKMHWFGSLISGSKAVLLRGVTPEWVLQTVSEEKATIVWLLVPWAQDILDSIDSGKLNLNDYELSQWRLMHIGAQPVPKSLIKRWMSYFPNHQYDTNYGLSESIGPGCVHLGVENIEKVGAIGISGYLWETKIVDDNFNEVPNGSVGELAVKGPGVMKCYYKNEEATNEVLRGEWLLTGDAAKRDEDGFIYLVDRIKDVIISGGENIYPVQIEDFLRQNIKIKDVAVIGLPDRRLGEISAAIIEVKPEYSCTEEEIMEFCNELPRYKRPRKVIFDKVPRNPTGKIEKPLLRKKYKSQNMIMEETID